MKRRPAEYWRSFASNPSACWTSLTRPFARPASREDCGETRRARHLARAGPGHDELTVPLEQAHQGLRLPQGDKLVGRRDEADDTALGEGIAAFPRLGCGATQALENCPHVRDSERSAPFDDPEEVLAHPGHPGELETMGHLV